MCWPHSVVQRSPVSGGTRCSAVTTSVPWWSSCDVLQSALKSCKLCNTISGSSRIDPHSTYCAGGKFLNYIFSTVHKFVCMQHVSSCIFFFCLFPAAFVELNIRECCGCCPLLLAFRDSLIVLHLEMDLETYVRAILEQFNYTLKYIHAKKG